jgi:raffinose/stachyose/melibiose transport system substrate-binding protein
MNMMRRKMSTVVTAGLLSMAIATGCTNQAEPVKPQDSAQPADSKQFKGEIVVSINTSPQTEKAFAKLAEAYNKQQPNVKLIYEPVGSPGNDIRAWLGTQLAAGTPRPDLVAGQYQPSYDKFVNFDKYRNKVNPYTGRKWSEDLDFDFFESRDNSFSRTMLPTQAAHVMWYYNKTVFDQLGIKPPANWEELVQISEKLNTADYIPIATNYFNKIPQWLHEVYFDQYHRQWNQVAKAQKGDYNYNEELDGLFKYDPNDPLLNNKYNYNHARMLKGLKEGAVSFDNSGHVEMVRNMAQVFPKYTQKDVFVSKSGEDYTLWLQQKAVMIVDTAGLMTTIQKDMANLSDPKRLEQLKLGSDAKLAAFEWGTFENPPMTGSLVQGPVRSVESATGEYVSIIEKSQEQTEMVLDFVMFWLSKAGYQVWVDGLFESGNGVDGPVMVRDVKLPKEYDELFAKVKMMGNAEIEINKWMLVGRVNDLKATGRNMFIEALQGKMTPEEYAKKFQELWMTNFAEIVEKAGLTMDHIQNPARQPGK